MFKDKHNTTLHFNTYNKGIQYWNCEEGCPRQPESIFCIDRWSGTDEKRDNIHFCADNTFRNDGLQESPVFFHILHNLYLYVRFEPRDETGACREA